LGNKIVSEGLMVDKLDLNASISLPIGLSKEIGGMLYTIAIDSMSFDTQGGTMGAYMSLEVPGSGQKLAFGARNIRFDEKGIKAGTKLVLLEDASVNFGANSILTFKGASGLTYINIDCDGFQGMGIDAELQMSDKFVEPENPDGSVKPGFVTASFQTQMASWGELMAKISLPPFHLTNLKNWGFTIKDAYFDYSDIANPSGIVFPDKYSSQERGNTWQGVFVKELTVRLPKEFKKKDPTKPISFSANNLLIDDVGLSGLFTIRNVLPIDSGAISNWRFGVDSIGIEIQANQLISGGLRGKIGVPIIDKENPLNYNAVISGNGDYLFQVSNTGNLKMDMWAAKISLYPNSSLTIQSKNGEFLPKANLTGKISVNPSSEGASASIADITFQGLQIQTISPIISADAFSLSSPMMQQKMSNFPIGIKDIGMQREGNDMGITFKVMVNLVGDGAKGFKGDAGLIVWGTQNNSNGIAGWKFKSVELTSISLDIDGGAFTLKGSLENYKNHPVYGRGYKGMIDAAFVPGLKVKATAQFGTINDNRYWYADALLIVPAGIPIATGFGLYGFGGGAYYHMKKEIANPVALNIENKDNPVDLSKDAGQSLSGVRYIPDINTGIGIKATVYVGVHPSPQPFNGSATFEITFNTRGGVSSIGLEGAGAFMKKIEADNKTASVSADLVIKYDFENSTLHGLMNAYINVAGIVRGTGTNNKAGQVVIHFDPQDWYIYIGHPDASRRIGLELAGLFQISSYFVIGTDIPEMPPPPAQVMSILRLDAQPRDTELMGKGGGFAFGASVTFDTGDLTFLVFYAKLGIGMGFDVMLKNYGTDARCIGVSGPVGINGWYAKGQAYAYLQGELGIKVDLTFVKGKFVILKCAAAVLMQAQLPNPTWLFGKVAADYDILGGLVAGRVDFEVEMGKKCQLVGESPLLSVRVISACSPADKEEKVDVFNAPQATFNIPVGKVFEMADEFEIKQSYRVALDYLKLSEGTNAIRGALEWSAKNDVVAFNSTDVLPGEKIIKMEVKIHFEQLINGSWKTVVAKSKPIEETLSSSFTTGPEPDNIVKRNIQFSYPIEKQFNFYKDEHRSGYIQLIDGQTKPFTLEPGFKAEGRMQTQDGGNKLKFNYSYNKDSKTVSFSLPDNIQNGQIYTIQLLKVPAQSNAAVDANLTAKVETKSEGTNTTQVTTKELEGTLNLLQEKSIYDNVFRTSLYSTFSNKIDALEVSPAWTWSLMTGVDQIGVNIKGLEIFDKFELQNSDNFQKLIAFEAGTDNNWLENRIIPSFYPKYPIANNMYLDWAGRTPTDILGVPPLKAIFIKQPVNDKVLNDSDISSGVGNTNLSFTEIAYDLVPYSYKDYVNLCSKGAANALRYSDPNIIRLMSTQFPNIRKGLYKFKIKYMLPGINRVTSEKEMSVNYR